MNSLYSQLDRWLGLNVEPQDLSLIQMGLRSLVLFVAAWAMLRLAHKRFFARRNTIDVLLTFILASTLARAINGSAAFFPTLGTGFLLVFVHRGLTFLGSRWRAFGRLAKGAPIPLIENGRLDEQTLRDRAMSREDLEEDLRINGVSGVADVDRAVMERNGEISVQRSSRVHTISVADGVQRVRIELG